MRKVATGGFALIGAASTVAWVVSLLTAKHHQPVWELLSVGLACFLIAACVEIAGMRRDLDREGRRDDLLALLDRLTRECQAFHGSMSDFGHWLQDGEGEIGKFSGTFATEYAQRHQREIVGPLLVAVPIRLERLRDIRRAVMMPGSHLGRPSSDPSRRS